MITLEQVQQLEERVRDVVGVIQKLRQENNELKNRIEAMESRERMKAEELDRLREDQSLIEEGLKDALNQLGSVTQEAEPAQDDSRSENAEEAVDSYGNDETDESAEEDAFDEDSSSDEEPRREETFSSHQEDVTPQEGSWQEDEDDDDQDDNDQNRNQSAEDQNQNFHQPPPQNLDIF